MMTPLLIICLLPLNVLSLCVALIKLYSCLAISICQTLIGNITKVPITSFITHCWISSLSTRNIRIRRKWATPFEKRRLRQISVYNVSTVRDGEKIQSWLIENRPRAFQWAVDGVPSTLPLSPPRVAQKPNFQFFRKIQFQSNKISQLQSCRESISYEITEKYRTESVSFHVKYWLKLTYPVVTHFSTLVTTAHTASEWRHA